VRPAAPQLRELAGEPGHPVHVIEQLGDPYLGLQVVERLVELLCLGRRDGAQRRHMQLALAQLHAFELPLGEETRKATQPEIQCLGALGEVRIHIRRDRKLGGSLCDIARWQQVFIEPLIVAGALDPHVPRSQAITQRGKDGGLIAAPIRLAVLEDKLLPLLRLERHRRIGRNLALPALIEIAQDFHRRQHWVLGPRGLELEGVQKRWNVLAVAAVLLGRRDERVLVDHLGQGFDLGLGVEQPVPANGVVDGGERIGVLVARFSEGTDGAVEQPHQPPNITRARLIAPLLAFVGLGEQRADQLVEHLDGGVRKPRFEIDDLGGQRGSTAAHAVIAEQKRRRDGTFSRQLPEPMLVDAQGELGVELHFADIGQTLDDLVEVGGPRRLRYVAEPGQRCALQCGVVDEQRIESGNLLGCQRRDQRVGGELAGTRPPGEANTLNRIRARQDDLCRPNAVHHGGDNHRALVGRRGGFRRVPQHQGQVAASRGAQAEQAGQLLGVILPRLSPDGIVTKRVDRDIQLSGQIAQQRLCHDLVAAQSEAGMAQQSELHRRAEDIAGAAFGEQMLQVIRRQRVVPGEARLVDGNAEELGPFVLCQQLLSAAHGGLRSVSPALATPAAASFVQTTQATVIVLLAELPAKRFPRHSLIVLSDALSALFGHRYWISDEA
jgi:hypothetical protein